MGPEQSHAVAQWLGQGLAIALEQGDKASLDGWALLLLAIENAHRLG